MPLESLPDNLADTLMKVCRAQISGTYEPRMIFRPGQGLIGVSRIDGSESVIEAGVTREDLRHLADADYVDLATPRNHWFVTVTPKALKEHSAAAESD